MQCPFFYCGVPWFHLILLLTSAIIFPALVIYDAGKRGRGLLQKLCAHLQGKVSGTLAPSFKGQWDGLYYSISLLMVNRNSLSYLVISFEKPCSFRLSIYKETVFTRLGEQLGIVREIKVNDPRFDEEFLIFSNKRQQAAIFLSNAWVKDAIRGLLNEGFTSFLVSGKTVTIRKVLPVTMNKSSADQIKTVVQRLASLCRGLYA